MDVLVCKTIVDGTEDRVGPPAVEDGGFWDTIYTNEAKHDDHLSNTAFDQFG